jgi:hypothetical protein
MVSDDFYDEFLEIDLLEEDLSSCFLVMRWVTVEEVWEEASSKKFFIELGKDLGWSWLIIKNSIYADGVYSNKY